MPTLQQNLEWLANLGGTVEIEKQRMFYPDGASSLRYFVWVQSECGNRIAGTDEKLENAASSAREAVVRLTGKRRKSRKRKGGAT